MSNQCSITKVMELIKSARDGSETPIVLPEGCAALYMGAMFMIKNELCKNGQVEGESNDGSCISCFMYGTTLIITQYDDIEPEQVSELDDFCMDLVNNQGLTWEEACRMIERVHEAAANPVELGTD